MEITPEQLTDWKITNDRIAYERGRIDMREEMKVLIICLLKQQENGEVKITEALDIQAFDKFEIESFKDHKSLSTVYRLKEKKNM